MELQNEDIVLEEGNVGEDQQQQQPEPPAKQLWQELNRAEYYTKPFEEFQKQFGSRDAASSLWKELNKAEYYTKDEKEFVNQFFPDLKKKSWFSRCWGKFSRIRFRSPIYFTE